MARSILGIVGVLSLLTGWSGQDVVLWYQRDVLGLQNPSVASFLESDSLRNLLMAIGVALLLIVVVQVTRDRRTVPKTAETENADLMGRVLDIVQEKDRTIQQLVALLGVNPSRVSRIVDSLQEQDQVVRRGDLVKKIGTAVEVDQALPIRAVGGKAPEATSLDLNVVANGMTTWSDQGGIHEGAYHVLLRDVLITNKAPHRVSLMPSLHIMVTPGAFGAGGHFPSQAETKPHPGDAGMLPWLHSPIGIDPEDSVRGYLWFTIGEGDMINIKGDRREVFKTERSNRLALRDMISEQTRHFDVPTLGYVHMDV